ncbi:MAG: UbiA family prenyltransferase [Candidatus Aenigmarchaeota archaeon]|nr:UbiA family prenyltransferase [Candidatus Aenigmarchaeota archaeon]
MVAIAGYLDMMRPANCFMAVISVLIGFFLVTGVSYSFFSFGLLFAVVAVFIITGAGNAINDYYDIESDKINKPMRPIPSGKISPNKALLFAYCLFVLGVLLSFINFFMFVIAFANSIILIIYSRNFQNKILIGNISIGYLAGSTFIYGGAAAGKPEMLAVPLILGVLASLATIAREIVKDLEDIEGDKRSFLKRIAKRVGDLAERFKLTKHGVKLKFSENTATSVALICILLAVIFSVLPYHWGLLGMGYPIVLIPCILLFIWSAAELVFRVKKPKDYARISKEIKIAMFIGFLAFIAGMVF